MKLKCLEEAKVNNPTESNIMEWKIELNKIAAQVDDYEQTHNVVYDSRTMYIVRYCFGGL